MAVRGGVTFYNSICLFELFCQEIAFRIHARHNLLIFLCSYEKLWIKYETMNLTFGKLYDCPSLAMWLYLFHSLILDLIWVVSTNGLLPKGRGALSVS